MANEVMMGRSHFRDARRLFALVLFAGLWAGERLNAAQIPQFDEAVSRFSAAIELPPRIRFDGVTRHDERLVKPPKDGATTRPIHLIRYTRTIVFQRDGQRLDVRVVELEASSRFFRGRESEPEVGKPVSMRTVVTQDWVDYRKDEAERGGTQGSVLLDSSREMAVQRAMGHLEDARVLEGYLDENRDITLPELLRGGTDKQVQQVPGSASSVAEVKLRVSTGQGLVEVWLDPQRNYLPTRIEISKSADDPYYGKTVRQFGLLDHKTVVNSFTSFIDESGNERLTGATITRTEQLANRAVREATVVHRRSNVQLDPPFTADAFKIDIANGTPARVEGVTTGLRYEWRDGKAVPVAQPGVARAIDGAVKHIDPFPRKQTDPVRRIPIAATVLVIAFIPVALLLWWWRRSGHHTQTKG